MRGIPAGSDGIAGRGGQGTFVVRWGSGLALTGAQKATMVMVSIGLLSASAYLSVPFFPVPLTMQTLAVLLIGGMLGPVLGASAVAGYVALGAMGAPVFHNGLGGPAVLAGPTGGYLIGFIAAAFVVGIAVQWAARIGRRSGSGAGDGVAQKGSFTRWASLLVLVPGVLVASAVIYAVGVPWLAVFTGSDLGVAVSAGALPFLLGDLLKGAVAIVALGMGGELLARRGLLLP
jgi:biotin transport system substrate-specific component